MRKVIVNSTPIIALAKAGKLDVLKAMYGQVIIPEAVFDEVTAKDDSAKAMLLKNNDWIRVKSIKNTPEKNMFRARLHDGEVEVMILARELDADPVVYRWTYKLDDIFPEEASQKLPDIPEIPQGISRDICGRQHSFYPPDRKDCCR